MKKPTKISKTKYYPYLTKDNANFDIWTGGFINVLFSEGWKNPESELSNMECRREYYDEGMTPFDAFLQEIMDAS